MGRKSGKAKEKKIRKKEEQQKLAARQAVVDGANALKDPLENLQPFKKFYRNGIKVDISCHRAKDLDKEMMDWAFELTKSNMQLLYESSGWGWNEKEKYIEMTDDKAWYLIAKNVDQNNMPVAMVHFRFDLDFEEEVLYCYEIQLEKIVRQKGLGRFLMQILEMMAFQTQMKKVMLTVLKCNPDAQQFFRNKLKYEVDETSPEDSLEEVLFTDSEYPYLILSKKIGLKKV